MTSTFHRPWPLPGGAPAVGMVWEDLLFAHWPVPVATLHKRIPPGLTLDTYDGQAWIGVVPFLMSGVKVRPFPAVPGTDRFPEINVRTYICQDGKPGVYFFSLDAASWLAVKAARAWYHLPYYHARITSSRVAETISYRSIRSSSVGQPGVEFEARYRPAGPATCGECGPLAHWLTERYCLYSEWRGRTFRADIHHTMWPLQPAEAEITINTMTAPIGITLPNTTPLLHFSRRLEVVAWPPQPI